MLDCDRPEFGELMGTADPDAPYTCGGADVRFVTVGSEVLHSYAFFRNLDTGICEPSVPGMFEYTHHYFEGDEVSEGTFAIVDPVTVGSGRIRSVYWTSEGTTLYAMGFHDTELDDPCTPYKFKDGSVRCIGTGAFPFLDSSASSTAACSQDLAQRFPLGCAEQGRTPVGFRRPAAGTWCGPQLSEIDGIAASVGPYEEPTVYVGQGQCAEVPRDTPTFRLGADLTPADYVEALSERTL